MCLFKVRGVKFQFLLMQAALGFLYQLHGVGFQLICVILITSVFVCIIHTELCFKIDKLTLSLLCYSLHYIPVCNDNTIAHVYMIIYLYLNYYSCISRYICYTQQNKTIFMNYLKFCFLFCNFRKPSIDK